MTWELAAAAIAPWLGEWVTTKIAEAVVGGVSSRLKPEDLGKALKTCATTADKQIRLFYTCSPRSVGPFLDRVFKDLAIEELQRPLKEEGTPPRIDFLVKAFQEALPDHPKVKQDIDESLIKPWLEVFAKTYFESTKTYLNFQIAKENYFKRLDDWFDDIKFAGIKVEGREIEKSAKLADIFVMPDVVEEGQHQKFFPFEPGFNREGNVSQRQAELLWEQRQLSRLGDGTGRMFLAQQLLSESTAQKLVLLGAPGSGKTTLMSYFTVMLAREQPQDLGLAADTDWLPILIRIRDLSRYSDISILEYVQQFARTNLSVNQLPTGFFEYWLDDGRALILLDGLDEIADSGKRDEIIRKIECFLGQFDKNRAIITSRPAGYKPVFFRTQELPHYTLQLFDESKVELFVKHWYESRFKDIEEAQRRQESLKKALTGQERIKVLAKNPLLLTIISLIHRYEADLPRQRYKLYDRAVKTLLTAWDAGKELDYKLPLDYLNRDDIERLMQQLAYWIHTQGGTGDKEGGTLIDKDELICQVRNFIVEQKGIRATSSKGRSRTLCGVHSGALWFIERLKDENYRVRSSAAIALGNLGNGSEQVIATLLERLKDENYRVRSSAAIALDNLGNGSEQVIAALLERLEDENDLMRYGAADALGNSGNGSEQVIAALLERLKDENYRVRSSAAIALGKLGKNYGDVATVVAERISQHPDSDNVGNYINVLWDVVAGESSV